MEKDWRQFTPIDKWLLIKADPRVKKTDGGIFLPDQIVAVERIMEGSGRVLKTGSRVKEVLGTDLQEGDRIMFRGFLKDAFHEFEEEDGCRIFLLHAKDALAVLDEEIDVGAIRPAKDNRRVS